MLMKLIKSFFIILYFLMKIPILSKQNIDNLNLNKIKKSNIKILVLIIASQDKEVYLELQKLWRSYMHYDSQHVESYFIRADPNLQSDYKIEGDVIWIKTQENLRPGILNKTLVSMEIFLPRIKEFDYILRTNLSSFYVFDRLLKFLENSSKNRFYCGSDIGIFSIIASGCGFLISPDIMQMLVQNKQYFLNDTFYFDKDYITGSDDFIIGSFLFKNGVRLIHHERMDIMPIDVWKSNKDKIPNNMFHFRIKNQEHLRLKDDIYIHSELIKMFYK